MHLPVRIAITPGEPAGIGPELVLKLGQQTLPCEIVVIASQQLLTDLANQFDIKIEITSFDQNSELSTHVPGKLNVLDVALVKPVEPGKLDIDNSYYVMETLTTAIELINDSVCHALTTGPVQKSIINDAGIKFSGHTEFIADKTGGYPVMLLTNEEKNDTNFKLRVALVTTHLPISEVSLHITAQRIEQVLQTLHRELIKSFGISNPNICVCGLNPHAGEDGHLGEEEINIIQPTLEKLRKQGMQLEGPVPADTAFTQQQLVGKDAIVAMYHDQGLPVIKHSGFGEIVNVTLGLPIIRTSVDHGTALDIAGQGIADVGSLQSAVCLAAKLANNRI